MVNLIWGINKLGQEVKEHDQLECTDGFTTWFTHVHIVNDEITKENWHREEDYYDSKVVGSYNNPKTLK